MHFEKNKLMAYADLRYFVALHNQVRMGMQDGFMSSLMRGIECRYRRALLSNG